MNVLNVLHTRNLLEIRIEPVIFDEHLIDSFVELFKANSNIRDIELYPSRIPYMLKIFHSLADNYVIKTVRMAQAKANKAVLELAEEFAKKRIAIEITLNCTHYKFGQLRSKDYILYYPE